MRQIALDTETTGLEYSDGHRIIEIGCVEIINRRITRNNFHVYIKPDCEIEAGALAVHGITNNFLADKPRFENVYEELIEYILDAELIIHNAPFDVGFLNHEFNLLPKLKATISDYCQVFDTLPFARQLHPGQKNSLDALCKRYGVDNSNRELHGALLDAELLANVYLAMTGGQGTLFSEESGQQTAQQSHRSTKIKRIKTERPPLTIIKANEQELAAHEAYMTMLQNKEN